MFAIDLIVIDQAKNKAAICMCTYMQAVHTHTQTEWLVSFPPFFSFRCNSIQYKFTNSAKVGNTFLQNSLTYQRICVLLSYPNSCLFYMLCIILIAFEHLPLHTNFKPLFSGFARCRLLAIYIFHCILSAGLVACCS